MYKSQSLTKADGLRFALPSGERRCKTTDKGITCSGGVHGLNATRWNMFDASGTGEQRPLLTERDDHVTCTGCQQRQSRLLRRGWRVDADPGQCLGFAFVGNEGSDQAVSVGGQRLTGWRRVQNDSLAQLTGTRQGMEDRLGRDFELTDDNV